MGGVGVGGGGGGGGGGAMGIETFFRFGLTPFNLLQTLMVKNNSIKQSINQQLCRSYIYIKTKLT